MATLSAKRLGKALTKAKQVGRAEIPVTIDGMKLVLQNLRPDQLVDAHNDAKDFDDVEYYAEWRRAHLCRSIVAIDEADLREVDYIEDDEVDKDGNVKTVRFQRHAWIRDRIVAEWPKEVVDVAFRKFAEVVELAEKKAADGVTFLTPDETPEEKFRRQLGEALETAGEVPGEIVAKLFEDMGLVRKVTAKEAQEADERLRAVTEERKSPIYVAETQEPEQPRAAATPARPAAPPPVAEEPVVPAAIARRPLNRVAPTLQEVAVPPVQQALKGRAAEYAALEVEATALDAAPPADPAPISGSTVAATPEQLQRLREATTQRRAAVQEAIEVQTTRTDMNAVQTILDQPPMAGINPRYRPPTR